MFKKIKLWLLSAIIIGFLIVALIANLYVSNYKDENIRKVRFGLKEDIKYQNCSGKILFIGDSRAKAWLNQYCKRIEYINQGVYGHTSIETLKSFKLNIENGNIPGIVILQVGINDLKCIRFQEEFDITNSCINNIKEIMSICTKNDIKLIYTSIFPVSQPEIVRKCFLWDDKSRQSIVLVNNAIKKIVDELEGCYYFDSFSFLLDGNQGKSQIKKLYSKDFLHLNETGYQELSYALDSFYLNDVFNHD